VAALHAGVTRDSGPRVPSNHGAIGRPRTSGWRSCRLWCSRGRHESSRSGSTSSHGARLPPTGWRLRQELRGLGCQQHPLHVLLEVLVSSSPSTAGCPHSRSVSSPHRPVSSPLTPPLILTCLWNVKLIQNFHMCRIFARYSLVPQIMVNTELKSRPRSFAMPKSAILVQNSVSSCIFASLMSQCTMQL
jgi:hypothetical protein